MDSITTNTTNITNTTLNKKNLESLYFIVINFTGICFIVGTESRTAQDGTVMYFPNCDSFNPFVMSALVAFGAYAVLAFIQRNTVEPYAGDDSSETSGSDDLTVLDNCDSFWMVTLCRGDQLTFNLEQVAKSDLFTDESTLSDKFVQDLIVVCSSSSIDSGVVFAKNVLKESGEFELKAGSETSLLPSNLFIRISDDELVVGRVDCDSLNKQDNQDKNEDNDESDCVKEDDEDDDDEDEDDEEEDKEDDEDEDDDDEDGEDDDEDENCTHIIFKECADATKDSILPIVSRVVFEINESWVLLS